MFFFYPIYKVGPLRIAKVSEGAVGQGSLAIK